MNLDLIIGILPALAGVIGALVALTKRNDSASKEHLPKWATPLLYFSLVLFFLGLFLLIGYIIKDAIYAGNPGATAPSTHATEGSKPPAPTVPETGPPETVIQYDHLIIGSLYEFGSYEQDGKKENGKEAIEWIVLSQDEDKVFLVSALGLDAMPFADSQKTSTWSESSIHDWLNETFYYTAFTDAEQKQILETDVIQNPVSQYPHCDQGEDVKDKVFLLSVEEYETYMYNGNIDSEYRNGTPSLQLIKNGLELTNNTYCWWWLRTSSQENEHAYAVSSYGVLDPVSHTIRSKGGMIRPAIWITIAE